MALTITYTIQLSRRFGSIINIYKIYCIVRWKDLSSVFPLKRKQIHLLLISCCAVLCCCMWTCFHLLYLIPLSKAATLLAGNLSCSDGIFPLHKWFIYQKNRDLVSEPSYRQSNAVSSSCCHCLLRNHERLRSSLRYSYVLSWETWLLCCRCRV